MTLTPDDPDDAILILQKVQALQTGGDIEAVKTDYVVRKADDVLGKIEDEALGA